VYLPDGRVAFTFARPELAGNESFDSGGMRFDVDEPMRRLRVRFEGKLVLLENPLEMADPRRAFADNPWTDAAVDLEYTALAPGHGGAPPGGEVFDAFARGHYVQHVAARGAVRVGDDDLDVDGLGLRDHSWGPRFWQSPWWYRWLTGNVDRENGLLVSMIGAPDGTRRIGGVMLVDGKLHAIEHAEIDSEYDDDGYHRSLRARVRTAAGEHEIEGEVLSLIPLRNRRDGMVTRISEGMTRWSVDGREGYGLSEYLDQVVDGSPVGNAHA
jgi:hypothetical protein